MRLFLFLSVLIVSFRVISSEATMPNRANMIVQAHKLTGKDLATFKLISSCYHQGFNCNDPLVSESIQAIIKADFNLSTATPLQKAIFELLKPIIDTYHKAILPAVHSSLTATQKSLLLDLAKCLFFKLNCEVKANFLLIESKDNLENLRNISSFKVDLDHAHNIALENGMVLGIPQIQPLETYQNQSFLALSQKFALTATDKNLFLRFIRFINEQNFDLVAEEI